ncbi:hypothetical protein [Myceligenerans indicum]|uniref:DUF4352 domain-containing protein n=1 Tax=Myceligenerans indicum TaxID=2593663 RepID=A0ABS1LES8_9MICO|nr:hypothetical protein [Myceligenerans indicum]MBL0884719.1 hypothetical protein [Myceligenerans indicum]
MTPLRRTKGPRSGIGTGTVSGKAAVLLAVSLLLSPALTACGPAAPPVGAEPSSSASGSPGTSATPESGDPGSSGGERDADDAGEQTSGGTARGDAHDTVVAGRATTEVVPLTADAVGVGEDLAVELTTVERTVAEATMPGEVAGSAIRIQVTVVNSGVYHALGASVVNLYYGPDRIPASSLSGSGENKLPDSVPAGEATTGTYEFAVPDDRTLEVLVEIDVDPQLHVALFEGEVSP